MSLFLTGTDTGIGKTYVSVLLVRALRESGISAVGMKPISCGDDGDPLELLAASGPGFTLEEINPIHFNTPAAPLVASRREGRPITLEPLVRAFETLEERVKFVLVEGAGGWLVPLNGRESIADLAAALGLPVVVVAQNRLGAINHTLLTVAGIEGRGLVCAGIILNDSAADDSVAALSNRALLEEISPVPVIAHVAHGQRSLPLTDTLRDALAARGASSKS